MMRTKAVSSISPLWRAPLATKTAIRYPQIAYQQRRGLANDKSDLGGVDGSEPPSPQKNKHNWYAAVFTSFDHALTIFQDRRVNHHHSRCLYRVEDAGGQAEASCGPSSLKWHRCCTIWCSCSLSNPVQAYTACPSSPKDFSSRKTFALLPKCSFPSRSSGTSSS